MLTGLRSGLKWETGSPQRTHKTLSLQLSFSFSTWMLPFSFSINNYFSFFRLHGNYKITALHFLAYIFKFSHTKRNFYFLSFLLRYNGLVIFTHWSVGSGPSSCVPRKLDPHNAYQSPALFWFKLTNPFLAQESQRTPPRETNKVMCPQSFHSFCLHLAMTSMCGP